MYHRKGNRLFNNCADIPFKIRRDRQCLHRKCNIKILYTRLHNNGPRQCIYYLFKKSNIAIKTVAPYNHQSLQAEHGIKPLSTILTNI